MNIIPGFLKLTHSVTVMSLVLLINACGGGGGGSSSLSDNSATTEILVTSDVAGSVGDGPVVGATLNIYDKDGNFLQSTTSNSRANYSVQIRAKRSSYPLTIEAVGGIDLVTGREPDFKMVSAFLEPEVTNVNINPYTTTIVKAARVMEEGLSRTNVDIAKALVMDQLNFGLAEDLFPDPAETEVNKDNIAIIIKSSEIFGEMIRRVTANLQGSGLAISADEVIDALAHDIVDGVIDGVGAAESNARIAAVATLASAQVLVEGLSNNLMVDGVNATAVMDAAVTITHPEATLMTDSVAISKEVLDQVLTTVSAARALAPSLKLTTIADTLATIPADSMAADIERVLPGDTSQDFDQALAVASIAIEEQLAVVNDLKKNAYDTESTQVEPLNITVNDIIPDNSAPIIFSSPALTVVAETTGNVDMDWVAPVARADGAALSMGEISGYKIYYGTVSGVYSDQVSVGSAYTTSKTLSGLPVGACYLVMTTIDADGRESGHSPEVEKLVQ